MHTVRAVMLILLVGILHMPAFSEPTSYRLGPNDIISVRVLRHDEFSGDFRIPNDGAVTFPGVGLLVLSGKTLAEVEEALRVKLAVRLQKPEVSMILHEARSLTVYAVGAVAKPGMYDMQPGWHIAELLAVAGGITENPIECTAGLLRRNTGRQELVDLPAILHNDAPANLPLEAGDILSIQSVARFTVSVTGTVAKPGIYSLKSGARITDLVAAAGGLATDAAGCTACILRGKNGVRIPLKLMDALKGEPSANFALEIGDMLLLDPPQYVPIWVSGAVKNPGIARCPVDASIEQAVAAAGGFIIPEGDAEVVLLRGDKAILRETYASFRSAGRQNAVVALQSGDAIEVTNLRNIQVTVAGEVKQPGTFNLTPNDHLAHLLSLAGGTLDTAAINRIIVRRPDGRSIVVNLSAMLIRGEAVEEPVLGTGALVIVPKITDHFIILGGVKTPGLYPFLPAERVTLAQALALAGGQTVKRGQLQRIAIIRNTASGVQERIVVDLRRYFSAGDPKGNPYIQPGDVVYVPEGSTIDWPIVLSAVSAFGVLNSSIH
ncbi:MAG: SLBB domain-containing protein [Armatimonadota bacterium]